MLRAFRSAIPRAQLMKAQVKPFVRLFATGQRLVFIEQQCQLY